MRFSIIQAIFQKEMLDMLRDRRTMISMAVVPLLVIPLALSIMTRVISRMEKKSEEEAKSMGIAARVTTPSIREALEKTGLQIAAKDDLKAAVEKKVVAASVEEMPGTPIEIRIYGDAVYLRWDFKGGYQEDSLLLSDNRRLEGTFRTSYGAVGAITGKRVSMCQPAGAAGKP